MNGNGHAHHYPKYNRAFLLGVILNVAFALVEAGYGFVIDALALLADAGHTLSGVLGLLLAWGGAYLAQKRSTPRRTYSWRRSTIYAALLNSVILYLAVGGIGLEAIQRLMKNKAGLNIWISGLSR
jgi:cobalt-zinc-cadmium efflux system protein